MRHPTHRNGLRVLFVARRQRDLELTRADYGVVEEELVKIAKPKKKQRSGMLSFELPVLLNHWSSIGRGHFLCQ